VPVRQPGYIQESSEGLGAFRAFSLESLETQPLRSRALDLLIEPVDFLVTPRGFRLARIRLAQLVERFLDGKFLVPAMMPSLMRMDILTGRTTS
jgi:hypothetical protein